MSDLLIKAALIGFSHKLPDFNPDYCFVVQWLFEEDNRPIPEEQSFTTIQDAIPHMANVIQTNKTLVLLSVTRRNA